MGVTCIQSSPFDENLIVVGSYDESVSIWDLRNTRRAVSDVKVGGGVWRIKWHPNNENIILAACMYSGFQLIDYENTKVTLRGSLFGSPQHETGKLAYGADWFRSEENYAALCSFYDSMCSCWKLK